MELNKKEKLARERVCIALDTDSVDQALEWSKKLSPYASSFKIGKSLHLKAGLEGRNIISEIAQIGGESFLDLKGHDTPDQIKKYAMAASVPGVYMFNIHIGSKAMNKAAIEGASEQAIKLGIERPLIIGVTELTSLDNNDLKRLGNKFSYDNSVLNKAKIAIKDGLDGIVCPAKKAGKLEQIFGNQLLYVTPGINMRNLANIGQKQLYEASAAVKDCSNSILIIGSAITKAPNMEEQAYKILKEMAPYMK
ncbi:orotidine-5'-phosphate decarboxylase [bacterium]|nr:orotidine-5'-phosphate decarboxylase [bacterium]